METKTKFYPNECNQCPHEMYTTLNNGTYKILIDDWLVIDNVDTSEYYIVSERLGAAYVVIDTILYYTPLEMRAASLAFNQFTRIDFMKLGLSIHNAHDYLHSIDWWAIDENGFNEDELPMFNELMSMYFTHYYVDIEKPHPTRLLEPLLPTT